MDIDKLFETDYEFREERKEEFLAALKEYGLFQLTEEGFHHFFKLKEDISLN